MKSNWMSFMFVSTYQIIAYFTLLYDTQLLPRPRKYIYPVTTDDE
jgi:hypothetical protein